MLTEMLNNVRENKPLVHNITNFVTVNDCANIVLASGGSPIMADGVDEVEEITSICASLNINIGTLNDATREAMLRAGKKANAVGHPVVLDPVGVGASTLRNETTVQLIKEVQFAVIRGNISEMKFIAQLLDIEVETASHSRGVDASDEDAVTAENLGEAVEFAKSMARATGSVIAMTGAIDIVANEQKAYCIFNGHAEMSTITGTGCQLSALLGAYLGANPSTPLEAAATAVIVMGVCGEIGHERMTELDGNSSYRNYIIDAVQRLTPEQLEEKARYEVR
ncbi:hydroxyethylthiazole kinase [Alloscardovia omnicolens]|uniref:hydroxyethylthiazole kinase n=1 Tax=Alloscardovia omnicolens TaxID=419015 RepID=UPI003A6A9D02